MQFKEHIIRGNISSTLPCASHFSLAKQNNSSNVINVENQ